MTVDFSVCSAFRVFLTTIFCLFLSVAATDVVVAQPIQSPIPDEFQSSAPAVSLAPDAIRIRVFADPSGDMAAVRARLPLAHQNILEAFVRDGDEHCVNVPDAPGQSLCRDVGADLSALQWDIGQVRFRGRGESACALALTWWQTAVAPELEGTNPVFAVIYGGPSAARFSGDCSALAAGIRTDLENHVSGMIWIQTTGEIPEAVAALAQGMEGRVHAIVLSDAGGVSDWSQGWKVGGFEWDRARMAQDNLYPGASPQQHLFYAGIEARGWRPLWVGGSVSFADGVPEGMNASVEWGDGSSGSWWLPVVVTSRLEGDVAVSIDKEAVARRRPRDTLPADVTLVVHGLGSRNVTDPRDVSTSLPTLQIKTSQIEVKARRKLGAGVQELDGSMEVTVPVCSMDLSSLDENARNLSNEVKWELNIDTLTKSLFPDPVLKSVRAASRLNTKASGKGFVHSVTVSPFSRDEIKDELTLKAVVRDPNGWFVCSSPCKSPAIRIKRDFPLWIPFVLLGLIVVAGLGIGMSRVNKGKKK